MREEAGAFVSMLRNVLNDYPENMEVGQVQLIETNAYYLIIQGVQNDGTLIETSAPQPVYDALKIWNK